MIKNQKADALYNDFADFEASFLDIITLIDEGRAEPNSKGHLTLHLFWQHLVNLNAQLYHILNEFDETPADAVSADAGAPAPQLAGETLN